MSYTYRIVRLAPVNVEAGDPLYLWPDGTVHDEPPPCDTPALTYGIWRSRSADKEPCAPPTRPIDPGALGSYAVKTYVASPHPPRPRAKKGTPA